MMRPCYDDNLFILLCKFVKYQGHSINAQRALPVNLDAPKGVGGQDGRRDVCRWGKHVVLTC